MSVHLFILHVCVQLSLLLYLISSENFVAIVVILNSYKSFHAEVSCRVLHSI